MCGLEHELQPPPSIRHSNVEPDSFELNVKVDFGGTARRVCLEHVPDAQPGDYLLVHVGFALSRIDEDEARRVFELLAELDQLGELEAPES